MLAVGRCDGHGWSLRVEPEVTKCQAAKFAASQPGPGGQDVKHGPILAAQPDGGYLSCLLEAQRFDELAELLSLRSHHFWHFEQFGAEALARQGKVDEAIEFAEGRRDEWYENLQIIEFCERTVLFRNRNQAGNLPLGRGSGEAGILKIRGWANLDCACRRKP